MSVISGLNRAVDDDYDLVDVGFRDIKNKEFFAVFASIEC